MPDSLFKIVFAIYLLVWWGLKLAKFHSTSIDIALSVVVVSTTTALMTTQMYVLYGIDIRLLYLTALDMDHGLSGLLP